MPFSREEVISALKNMHPQKVPGLDSVHACFFQQYWQVVKDNVFFAVKVLNEGLDLSTINHAHISLVLKIKSPTMISHYRPIVSVMSFTR